MLNQSLSYTLSDVDRIRLVQALSACPMIQTRDSRDTLLRLLPIEISQRISRHTTDLIDLTNIVSTCASFPDGLRILVERVREFEGASLPMAQLDAAFQACKQFGEEVKNLSSSQLSVENANQNKTFNQPEPHTNFVGRTHEITLLKDILSRVRSLVIEGPGGIGKTQLIINTLHGQTDIPTVWIEVEHYRTVADLQIALTSALQQLGVNLSPQTLIASLYSTRVRIVFDGVEQAQLDFWDETEDFFRLLLTRTAAPQLIFTSQASLDTLHPDFRLELEPLERADAQLLLAYSAQLDTSGQEESYANEWLVDFSDGHPLTLSLIGGQLRRFRRASVVMERIQHIGSTALDQQHRKKQTRLTSLQVALRLSYETISANQQVLLLYLSFLPAGCWDKMLEHSGHAGDLHEDVSELCYWHVVDRRRGLLGELRYYVLSPIRLFVQSVRSENEIIDIQFRIADQLVYNAMMITHQELQYGNTSQGTIMFDIDFANYMASFNSMSLIRDDIKGEKDNIFKAKRIIYGFSESMSTYLFVRGYLYRGIDIIEQGINSGEDIGSVSDTSYLLLIRMYERIHDYKSMEDTLSRFAIIAERSNDVNLLGTYATACGDLASIKNKNTEAIEFYIQAENYYNMAIENVRNASNHNNYLYSIQHITGKIALVLAARSLANERMHNFVSGLELALRAQDLLESLGDEVNKPSTQYHIGMCYAGINEIDTALHFFISSAINFHRIGSGQFLSNSLAQIGTLIVQKHKQLNGTSLDDEVVIAGLDDIANEMRLALSVLPNIQAVWAFEVLKKAFSIMALTSYQLDSDILDDWAIYLREEIIIPLFEDGRIDREDISMPGIIVRELDLIACIAHAISNVRLSNTDINDKLPVICSYCYELVAHNWEISPFDWLSQWINIYYPQQSVTTERLQRAAVEAFQYNKPFRIE